MFECHAHVFNVLDHITTETKLPAEIYDALWSRLDSIVKQWIYGTISSYLLQTVLYRGDSARVFWDRLKAIFHDNKLTRAVYLENQFNSLHLSNFSEASPYCTKLKNLKDQLANLDQPESEQKLVLRLVSGLMVLILMWSLQ